MPATAKKESYELQFIKGIGPKRAEVLFKNGIKNLKDLLLFFPRRYIDRSTIVPLNKLKPEEEVTVIGKIESSGIRRARRPFFFITISDGTGFMDAVWFNSINYFKNRFNIGDWISLSGKISFYRGYQITHPEYDRLDSGEFDNLVNTGKILAIYPGNESFKNVNLNSNSFRRIFMNVFENNLYKAVEYLPDNLKAAYSFPDLNKSLKAMHLPENENILKFSLKRFKFEEFFFQQMLFALQKQHLHDETVGISFRNRSIYLEKLYKSLKFELTEAQKRVMRQIRLDMKSEKPMNRLLQGDVGSGKTLVALMAALVAIDNGHQVALMAPTEILAEQHFLNICDFLKDLNVRIGILTGSLKNERRQQILYEIANHDLDLVIGTHALFQEKVRFFRLGLTIIDEQHRFGVMQRGSLISKGVTPDVLVMTATPIPRTLAMTVYGSLDVSVINELPRNRKPIRTIWRLDNQADKIYKFIREQLSRDEQVYIVYPLVEESEKMDLKAATEGYNQLCSIFKEFNVGLLHGRLDAEQKEQVMRKFASGKLNILVATTVIEVGVDVANATVILVEHAERFGLSQLHQLRGRVGRGEKQSFCILKTPNNVTDTARERLRVMTETSDGFVIAEKDLELRGWGDFFGTKQSGMPLFKLANPIKDFEILEEAKKSAFAIVRNDPQLRKAENRGLHNKIISEYKDRIELAKIS